MSSHLRRYRRGQRIAAGAVLASSALFAPYLLALRPMVSYASQRTDRSQLSPRSGSGPCSLTGAYTTVLDDTQLQAAVIAAQDDTQICIAPQVDDTIVLSGTLQFDDTTVTLVGADDTNVVLSPPTGSQRHIGIRGGYAADDTVTLLNLTLDGGGAAGGIYAGTNDALVLRDDTFIGNYRASSGGAVDMNGGSLFVYDSSFIDNQAKFNGGAIWVKNSAVGARTVIQESHFEANHVSVGGSSGCSGGAIFIRQLDSIPARISGSTFEGNYVGENCVNGTGFGGGGAIATGDTVSLIIDDSTNFTANVVRDDTYGGGAISMDDTATLTINGATFTDDSTLNGNGGAIFLDDTGTLTLTDAHFSGTNALGSDAYGGAVFLDDRGTLAVTESTFFDSSAHAGGAIYISRYSRSLVVQDSTFARNHARGGGAISAVLSDDTLVISGSSFYQNSSGGGGGGSLNIEGTTYGPPTDLIVISDTVFRDDSTSNEGGSMRISDSGVTLDSVTVSGSEVSGGINKSGGGIDLTRVDFTATNSTIAGNFSSGWGGGLSAYKSTVALNMTTVTGNSAGARGGGVFVDGTAPYPLSLINSVVSGNTAVGSGDDVNVVPGSSDPLTLRNSFFTSDDTASIDVPVGTTRSNLLFGDPMLGNLGNNGGPFVGAPGDDTFIPTQLPAAGSPLIGAGLLNLISPAVTVDQLGNSRVQSAFPNQTTIGALFRALPNPTPPSPGTPPSAPREVTATGGDASATVTWTAPASAGSFPITNYRATAAPSGKTCLVVAPATTCRVEELTNGTSYTFTVAALNGAGWGSESGPSNAVTPEGPTPPVDKTIVITGTRGTGNDNRTIYIAGTTTGLTGTVEPHYRFPGGQYTLGSTRPAITDDGTFTWKRRSGKKTYIFFTHSEAKSNRIIVPS